MELPEVGVQMWTGGWFAEEAVREGVWCGKGIGRRLIVQFHMWCPFLLLALLTGFADQTAGCCAF